jgi:hypothetical protein
VTRRVAGRVMANHTRRILSNPRICGLAIQRNVTSSRKIQTRRRIPTVSRPIGLARPRRIYTAGARRRPMVGAVRGPVARRRY